MSPSQAITFVIAVNNRDIFEKNFMASPCLKSGHPHEIIVQEGFASASKAYNDAIARSENELLVFCHQDILLPEFWISQLDHALEFLDRSDPRWGVLGCYGEAAELHGHGYVYSNGLGIRGKPEDPAPVQTLDEILLILRKSKGLRFDENLPHYHFYGADICMAAAAKSMKSYAISAFCIHNSQYSLVLPKEFYESYKYFRRKWRNSLPVQTTCIKVTRSNFEMYGRRLREFSLQLRHKEIGASRIPDGRELLNERVISPNSGFAAKEDS